MNLRDKLINVPRRENSGAMTQKRYDYQKHWAICKILDLHKGKSDYLVLLEFHEDVTVLDCPINPTRIEFYQLKSVEKENAKNWTMTDLLAQKKLKTSKSNSILGKLYYNKVNFPNETTLISLVSNQPFQFNLKNKTDSSKIKRICCIDISDEDSLKLKTKIKEEIGAELIDTDLSCIHFEVSDLVPSYQERLTKDYIREFLEEFFPGMNYQISPIYRALFAEVSKLSSYDKDVNNFDDLLQKKGVHRNTLNSILSTISTQNRDIASIQRAIESDLRASGFTTGQIYRFKNDWRELEVYILEGSALLERIKEKIDSTIQLLLEAKELEVDLLKSIDIIFNEYSKSCIPQVNFSDQFIKTLILRQLYVN